MSDDSPVSGQDNQQRPMWEVQPGPVKGPANGPTGPFSPQAPPAEAAGQQPPQQGQQPPQGQPQGPPQGQGAPQGQQQSPYGGPPPGPNPYQQAPEQGRHAGAPPQGPGPGPAGYPGAAPTGPGGPQGQMPGGPQGSGAPMAPPEPERVPTAQDFLRNRHQTVDIGPATWGWRGRVRKGTFGLIKPKMGKKEKEYREARAVVQRSFSGPRTIMFANPKGGAAKTTSVLAAGYTFGTIRGGGVVAWDNNETRGTLGIRGERANHQNTTRELLDDLEKFSDVFESRIGDLGAFVRSQGDAHFDVLASDERADVTGTIRATDFGAVHRLLERFYHLILVDTGNNLRAENWLASAQTADLIVVTCTVREDTGYSGLWMLDALADAGHTDIRQKTITVLADPSQNVDEQLAKDLVEVYSQRTRGVFRVPYDPALVAGSVLQYGQLSAPTRAAWLKACAAMAEAL